MKLKPKLITFDFGDTLVSSKPPYLVRIWMGLKELGIKRTSEDVKRAYHRADLRVSQRLLREGDYSPERFQKNLSEVLLDELGIKMGRGGLIRELTDFLIGFRPERVMVPGARYVLEELKRRGYEMGIISNNDGRTREKCASVGIEHYFSFILDSTLEGMCKPDPAFFKKALRIAGVQPKDALHTGDLLGSDILGARKVGLCALWIENNYVKPLRGLRFFRVKKVKELLNYIE